MNRLKVTAGVALTVHLMAFLLMFLRIEPFYTFFYLFAWWSYIVFLSAVNSIKGQNSILFDRTREFLPLVLFSCLVWFFFEAYNFRLRNWSYLGVPLEPYIRWPGYILGFGTVLPGILETERLLFNFGVFQPIRSRKLRIPPGLLYRFILIGTLMMVAPLIGPSVFFPLVWIGLILLLDPLLYLSRRSGDSFLARAEEGEYGRLIRFFFAGLLCGVLWEFWNFWAGSKWVYHIPLFDRFPVFEMPVLGFFGFPFFALECYLLYRVFMLSKEFEMTRHRLVHILLVLVAVVYSVAVIRGIDQVTVITYRVFF